MTVSRRTVEIVKHLSDSLAQVEYHTEAGRMEDYSYECLNSMQDIERQIDEELDSAKPDMNKVKALNVELNDYQAATDYFRAAMEIEDNKADKTEEEMTMTEQTVVEEGKGYYDVIAEVNEDNLQAALADEGMVSGEQTTTEEETTMTEEQVKPNTQEAALIEYKAALNTRHLELNAKFEDLLATAKQEAATGSVELAAMYRDMATLVEQQLQEVEAKLATVNKQLTKLRVAKAVAAPVIAVVVAAKAIVRISRVVFNGVAFVGRFVVRSAKKVVATARRVFTKTNRPAVSATVTTAKATATTVVSATKAKSVRVAHTVKAIVLSGTARVVGGARKGAAMTKAAYGYVANHVLAASILAVVLARKAGTVLNNVSTATHTVVSNAVSNVKGFRFRKATTVA